MEETKILDTLFDKGVLIDLHVTWWRGRKNLSAEDLGLDPKTVNPELFSLGQKRLLPRMFTKHWNRWDIQGRMFIDEYAFRYGNRLGHFVPLGALEDLIKELERCRGEFYKKVEEFCDKYRLIIRAMLDLYNEEAEKIHARIKELNPAYSVPLGAFKTDFLAKIKEYYPAEPPRQSFSYEWSFYEFRLPRKQRAVLANVQKKASKLKDEEAKRDVMIDSYRRNVDTQVSAFLSEAVSKLRAATAELFEKLSDQVKEGNVTDKRLDRMRDFIRRFRTLNFLEDGIVEKELASLESFLQKKKAEDFNTDESLGKELQKALGGVLEVAKNLNTDSVVNQALGFMGRKVKK